MVGPDGALPLPWIDDALRRALATPHAHALLVHGPPGVGQFELALTLAQAWLCEAAAPGQPPCGRCAACRLVQAHTHPDLLVLLPEALREPLGWSLGEEEGGAEEKAAGKRKPSKDIRVDEVRQAIAFAQTSSARGRAKAVVLHPAERLNPISANALLKTLEEPPGAARLVLSTASPDALLPTLRSRCQAVALPPPDPQAAARWLGERGVPGAAVLLAAAGGQPLDALEMARLGVDARQWQALPQQLLRGDPATVAALAAWPLPRVLDMLLKLCHDAMRAAAGAAPRYFPAGALLPPPPPAMPVLAAWARELQQLAGNAEHPWNAGLMVEHLTQQAREALSGRISSVVAPEPAATLPRR